jgi:hypothetical protein
VAAQPVAMNDSAHEAASFSAALISGYLAPGRLH